MQHLDKTAAPDEGSQQNLVHEPVGIAARMVSERFNLSLELAATISELANPPGRRPDERGNNVGSRRRISRPLPRAARKAHPADR
jgi:hypothetical protein